MCRCVLVCVPLQLIYDLLVKNSPALDLREDPELGVQVAGLRKVVVDSGEQVLVGCSLNTLLELTLLTVLSTGSDSQDIHKPPFVNSLAAVCWGRPVQ